MTDDDDHRHPRRARTLFPLQRVLETWLDNVDGVVPWCSMPLDDRTGRLRHVLAAALDRGDGVDDPERRHRLLHAAALHGAYRRAQRAPKDVVSADLAMLRDALTSVALTADAPEDVLQAVMRALIADCAAARRVALSSYEDVESS